MTPTAALCIPLQFPFAKHQWSHWLGPALHWALEWLQHMPKVPSPNKDMSTPQQLVTKQCSQQLLSCPNQNHLKLPRACSGSILSPPISVTLCQQDTLHGQTGGPGSNQAAGCGTTLRRLCAACSAALGPSCRTTGPQAGQQLHSRVQQGTASQWQSEEPCISTCGWCGLAPAGGSGQGVHAPDM